MNPIANNPVITKDLTTLAIFFAAWKLLGLSLGESAAIAGTFNAGAAPFVRQLVTPNAKLEGTDQVPPPPGKTYLPPQSSGTGTFPASPDPGKPGMHP